MRTPQAGSRQGNRMRTNEEPDTKRSATRTTVSAALALAALVSIPASAGAVSADWEPRPEISRPHGGVYEQSPTAPAPRYAVTMESFLTVDESGNDSFGTPGWHKVTFKVARVS